MARSAVVLPAPDGPNNTSTSPAATLKHNSRRKPPRLTANLPNAAASAPFVMPARPVVARAYLDQLARSDTLPAQRRMALAALLDRVGDAGTEPALAAELTSAAEALADDVAAASGRTEQRLRALAATLTNLAERLR